MITPQLLNYIKQQMQQGKNIDQIKQTLLAAGWKSSDLEAGFNSLSPSTPTPPTPQVPPIQTTTPPKNSKKTILLISLAVIMLLLIAGGVYAATQGLFKPKANPKTSQNETPANNDSEDIIDCQTDMNCFIDASGECKPATVTYDITANVAEVTQKTTLNYEINGLDSDKCVFSMQTVGIKLTFPDGYPEEKAASQQAFYDKQAGKTGSCKMDTTKLTDMLTRWNEGTYNSSTFQCSRTPDGNKCTIDNGDFAGAECEGSAFGTSQ